MSELPTVLEQGDIFFYYRPRVDADAASSGDDVQRFLVVLHAVRPRSVWRLLLFGRKRLPDLEKGVPPSERRSWALVDAVARDPRPIRRALAAVAYPTATRGERHVDPAVPVGEGGFELAKVRSGVEFRYALELPRSPGPAQEALGIEPRATLLVAVRNPSLGGASPFPESLLERFGQRRWIPPDDLRFLDYRGAQLLFIGARPGAEIPTQEETLSPAEVTRLLGADVHRARGDPTADLERAIAGISFPARRASLVRRAQENAAPAEVVRRLRKLPARDYATAADVAVGIGEAQGPRRAR